MYRNRHSVNAEVPGAGRKGATVADVAGAYGSAKGTASAAPATDATLGWKIWNASVWIILGILVLLTIALLGVRLFGITPYTLLSSSMEPTLHTGALVYSIKVAPEELKAGDIVTWRISPGTDERTTIYCTHRLQSVDSKTLTAVTKGDANEHADTARLDLAEVYGKVVFSIPYLGYFEKFIHTSPGIYIAVALMFFIFLYIFAPLLVSPRGKTTGSDDITAAEQTWRELGTPIGR